MYKTFVILWIVCCLLSVATLSGCVPKASPERHTILSSRSVTIRREYLPPSGGQTIRPPQRMADVTTLWMPLTREEHAKIASYHSHIKPSMVKYSSVSSWLPPSERKIMEDYLYRLTVSQKGVSNRVLERADNFLDMIHSILEKKGLPPELAALPLVESAFEPKAVSKAGAAGLWQLMPVTARRFGLIVNASQDERFDSRKATEAATSYLSWLYERFKDWPLALAAYNCGEGAMDTFLRRYGVNSLNELSVVGREGMPQETLQFVPKFVAAATVMQAGNRLSPQHNKYEEQDSIQKTSKHDSPRIRNLPQTRTENVPSMRMVVR